MKPWGRFVFIFIAYGIALLHTAVPHQHPQGIEGQTTLFQAGCIANESTSGFLKMILSTDLGYGHLETFNRSADISLDLSFAGLAIIAVLIPFSIYSGIGVVCREYLDAYIDKIYKNLLLFSTSHFRAPPMVSCLRLHFGT